MNSPVLLCPACQQRYATGGPLCPNDGTSLVPVVSMADRMLGQVIGERYRIVARIGEGGMGTVYKAAHTMMERFFAVKVLRNQLASNENAIKRFQREAQAASRLDHEHCVRVTDFGRSSEGALFLIMEYVDGLNLKTALEEAGGRMEPARAIRIAQQIASALSHAHSQGLIHRDLKPDNVLLTERSGRSELVKVVDFGLAKLMAPVHEPGEETDSLTESGVIFGTPSYMAPEQAQGYALDGRTDIYSLGVILYQLLTGTVPFAADNPVTLLTKQVLEPPIPPRTRVPEADIPEAVEQLVLTCLSKDAKDRPGSADEVRALLSELRTPSSGLTSVTLLDSYSASYPKEAPWKRVAWWLTLVVAGGLTVVLALTALLRRPGGESAPVATPGGGRGASPTPTMPPPPRHSPPPGRLERGSPEPPRPPTEGSAHPQAPREPNVLALSGAGGTRIAEPARPRGGEDGTAGAAKVRTEAPPPRRGGDHPAPVRPSKLDELLREAASARRDGHLAAARESLERANTLRPGDPRVDEAYGDLLLEVGNLKEASRRYRKAVNARATTTLWLKLSDTLAAQGDGSGACAALARASKMDPGDRVLRRRQSKYRCR